MPRQARARTESGIHHIVVQGVRRKNIFEGKTEKDLYRSILLRYKGEFAMELYAYCILANHCHILLREGEIDVSSFMRRVGVSYSYWYKKEKRPEAEGEGAAVFRGRYRSEPLEEERIASVTAYIQNEPVRKGIASCPEEYFWSSAYRCFGRPSAGQPLYAPAANERGLCLEEVPAKFGKSREEAEAAVRRRLGGRSPEEIQYMDREERNNLLRQMRHEDEISIQLLAQITGVGRGVIQRLR